DVARAPAHRLGEGDAGAQLRQERRQNLAGGLARLAKIDGRVLALVGRDDTQRVDGDALLSGETLAGLGRRAVREGNRARRTEHRLRAVTLAVCEAPDEQRQAARRTEGLRRPRGL